MAITVALAGRVTSPSYRFHRGGCWWNVASLCRSAHRDWYVPASRYVYLGFRPVRRVSSNSLTINEMKP